MKELVSAFGEKERLDLLDRQAFVERMLTVANYLSDNKKNACYAINGDWGVGKSFVLDMFEATASSLGKEGEELPRYLIFRYNCWEYDYYDEPLVAIVASMLDQIDKIVNLASDDMKAKITAILKVVGMGLVKKASQMITDKTGVDIPDVAAILKEGSTTAKSNIQLAHEYDQYFDFKKKCKALQETISSLSRDQTVIFIVDELDRCLPEYTIMVLERLHHLFNGISNVQVILSIDGGQLEHVVRQIYGEGTDAKKYLKKFISFELRLDCGSLNNRFAERFNEYCQKFEVLYSISAPADIEQFNKIILDGIDIRNRIAIIERCMLLHNIVCESNTIDSSYMCLELLLTLLHDCEIDLQFAKSRFRIDHLFEAAYIYRYEKKNVPQGLLHLGNYYEIKNRTNKLLVQENSFSFINCSDVWGVILGVYRQILGFENDHWEGSGNKYQLALTAFGEKFWETLQIIS